MKIFTESENTTIIRDGVEYIDTGVYLDEQSSVLTFNRTDIDDISYVSKENGDFIFNWNVKDKKGNNINLYDFYVSDNFPYKYVEVKLTDDESGPAVNQLIVKSINFVKDHNTGDVINVPYVRNSNNIEEIDFLKKVINVDSEFYRNRIGDNECRFLFTGYLDEYGDSVDGGSEVFILFSYEPIVSNQFGENSSYFKLSKELPENVKSGVFLYKESLPRTHLIGHEYTYTFNRSLNNKIYSNVHSGGYYLSGTKDEYGNKYDSVVELPPTSGKRSINLTVSLLDSNFDIIQSKSIRAINEAPSIVTSGIIHDPKTNPGSIIFNNINYLPNLEEKTIKKVEVYTGSSSDIIISKENFAFQVDGPYGGSNAASFSNGTSDLKIISHENIKIPEGSGSLNIYYKFLPYDQFGSGFLSDAISAYVINRRNFKQYDIFDSEPPSQISDLVVNGGFGGDFIINWSDDMADSQILHKNNDISHYELWYSQEPLLKISEGVDYNNVEYIRYSGLQNTFIENEGLGTGLFNASLLLTTDNRSVTVSNTGELGYFWVRTVDKAGNKSKFYPDSTGVNNVDRSIPPEPLNFSITSAFESFEVKWENPKTIDIKEYEIWKSDLEYLQSGVDQLSAQDAIDDTKNTGYIYLDDQNNQIPDHWVNGGQKLVASVAYPGNFISITGARQEYSYFWIRSVDGQGNKSRFSSSVTGIGGRLGTLQSKDIDSLTAGQITAGAIAGQEIIISNSEENVGSIKTLDFETSESGFALSGDGSVHFKGSNKSYFRFKDSRLELIGTFINSSICSNLDSNNVSNEGALATFIGGGYNNNIRTEGGAGSGIASAIVAGGNNWTEGRYTTIAGGISNTGINNYSFIGGGLNNILSTGSNEAFLYQYYGIRGGGNFIGAGGYNNITSFNYSSIVGGYCNLVSGNGADISNPSNSVSILGGTRNCIIGVTGRDIIDIINENDSDYSVIVGGNNNLIFQSTGSFIGNGNYNKLCHSDRSSIINGEANCIIGLTGSLTNYNTINNGRLNKISSSSDDYYYNTIVNGQNNQICNGRYVAYLGGNNILSTGVFDSLAFGRNICLTENSVGNLVFADTDYLPRTNNCIVKNSRQCNSATFYFCCGVYFQNTVGCSDVCFKSPVVCATNLFRSNTISTNTITVNNYINAGDYIKSNYICANNELKGPSIHVNSVCAHCYISDYKHLFYENSSLNGIVACISADPIGGFTGIYSNYDLVSYSDCRGKSNITTIDKAIDKVNMLQGRMYYRNDIGGKHYGLVAQEVAKAVPELAFSGDNGNTYGVKYQNTVALLIEAIKEQNIKINMLEQKIKDLL
jgi:hypothetical protein